MITWRAGCAYGIHNRVHDRATIIRECFLFGRNALQPLGNEILRHIQSFCSTSPQLSHSNETTNTSSLPVLDNNMRLCWRSNSRLIIPAVGSTWLPKPPYIFLAQSQYSVAEEHTIPYFYEFDHVTLLSGVSPCL